MEKEVHKKVIRDFLNDVMNFPYDFEILYKPEKIWIPYQNDYRSGYYFNYRLGEIENLPTIVLTPKSSLSEWIGCEYENEDILTPNFLPSSKPLTKVTSGLSYHLKNLFNEKQIFPKGKNTNQSDYYNQFQFKFDYNEEQSQFLFKLNQYVKEISKGVFRKVYVSADPHCAKPININFLMDRFNRKVIDNIRDLLQKKYNELEFNFVRHQEDHDTIDLRWSESDPKNWDKEKKENYRISTFNKFKEGAINKFGNAYEYYLDNFVDMNTSIKVFCKKHKSDFVVVPNEHLNGKRCPKDIESSGENMVRTFLEKNKISFLQYHKMKGCFSEKNGKCFLLTFDFYVPSKNLIIEYDGGQHFGPVSIFGGEESYKRTIMLDSIKNEFCKDNNIKMLRIPYTKTTEEAHQMLKKELGM
jgi:very-short-patch-repair endonuclease